MSESHERVFLPAALPLPDPETWQRRPTTWTGPSAAGAPPRATYLSSDGPCQLVVHVNIGFKQGDSVSDGLFGWCVSHWPTMIENLWNDEWESRHGPQRWRCCNVRFEVHGRVSQGAADHHQITIDANLAEGSAHSGIGTTAQTGTWPAEDPDGVIAAHETGHLMGLYDEYDENGGPAHCAPPKPDCAGATSADLKCIMASTENPAAVIALPQDVAEVLNGLQAECPLKCCAALLDRERARVDRWPPRPPPFDVPGVPGLPAFDDLAPRRILEVAHGKPPHVLAHAAKELQRRPADSLAELTGPLREGPEDARWLAAIALARVRGPAVRSALRRALADGSISVRIQAARSLLEHGWTTGLDVLVDALESDARVIRHPPALARDYAHQVLQHYTGEDFGFDPFAHARRHPVARWRAYVAARHHRDR